MPPELRTDRLLLRAWRDEDLAPFAALNADPEVMRYFPATLPRADSDALAARIRARFAEDDVGLWAVELTGEFVGFTGVSRVPSALPFAPAVEVGWRLARAAWGHGYATEAARAAVGDGFGRVGLAEIVSFTASGNERSRAVMCRLGMARDVAGDFEHPAVPPGHPLRRHVLYRLPRPGAGAAPTGPIRSSRPADPASAGQACWRVSGDPVRLTAWVRGRVQGVGYRWWVRSRALELGLTGTATNLDDGRVEVVTEGPRSACESLLELLEGSGTPGRVQAVVPRWSAARGTMVGFTER